MRRTRRAAGGWRSGRAGRTERIARDLELLEAGVQRVVVQHAPDQRLADPLLSVATLAAELQLSAGHVHRLFQSEPAPLAHYIWNRRLDACQRDLRDPACAGHSIAAIAYSRGFNDAAHFSRSFRRRFGVSPREYRCAPPGAS